MKTAGQPNGSHAVAVVRTVD